MANVTIDHFFNWIQFVDYYCDYMNVEEEKQVKLVVCKLKGRAQAPQKGSKEEQELVVEGLVKDELELKDGLVVDELKLKKDGFVVGEIELKKDLVGFISNFDPFHIHLVGALTNTLNGFKTKEVKHHQWQIAWSFSVFHWRITLVPL
ncbi:hypothetical protein L484_012735 [Morus notabilis]|uniref:Uncharacterized protein n=1 Tax=Morus notabilis TaxID=981085 RepID=W9R7R1_9ROSA|nr:hypothetical protein L484_012735 [Morus notabilis]